jgi:hypothetical protein
MRLKGVNPQLLREVVEQLCKELGGQMTTSITDYYGKSQSCPLAFKCNEFPRGVGFVLEKGEVSIKGDFYGYHGFENTIQKNLTQQYTAQAHIASFKQMGFQTQTQKIGEKIVVRAYQW